MNYEEMSDFEVNQAVTGLMFDCAEWPLTQCGKYFYHCGIDGSAYFDREVIDYCNNPSDAWPIIETIWSELSSVVMFDDGIGFGERNMTMWNAQCAMMSCGKLRAAMIVFLKMQEQTK